MESDVRFSKVGGKCPDGTVTYDLDTYLAEWNKITTQLEAKGFRVIGFDPSLLLCDMKTGCGSFDIPVYAVMKFLNQ